METLITVVDLVNMLGFKNLQELITYFLKNHGSKVKEGAFKGCTIELAEDRAFIAVTPKKGEIVWLTSDNIQSYQYVKEKERFRPLKMAYKTYYYYTITFKDGSQSYVRMRKKYRKAMMKYTQTE
jgi:hypothetical protein